MPTPKSTTARVTRFRRRLERLTSPITDVADEDVRQLVAQAIDLLTAAYARGGVDEAHRTLLRIQDLMDAADRAVQEEREVSR